MRTERVRSKLAGVLAVTSVLLANAASPGPLWGLWQPGIKPVVLPSSQAPLSNVIEVRSMTPDAAEQHLYVRVRAVITYCHRGFQDRQTAVPICFAQDKTAGIFVKFATGGPALRAGDFVEIKGTTDEGWVAPIIIALHTRLLGRRSLPRAARMSIANLQRDGGLNEWVEYRGVVHGAIQRRSGLWLELGDGAAEVPVWIPDYNDEQHLFAVDTELSVRGVAGCRFDGRKRTGFVLFVPGPQYVDTLSSAPENIWTIPLRDITTLPAFNLESGHRIHLHGVVTLTLPDHSFYLQDATGGIYVAATAAGLRTGDNVDVIGFPGRGKFKPLLQRPLVRINAPANHIDGTLVTAETALRGDYDAELIRIRATVTGRYFDLSSNASVLQLQAGSEVFRAVPMDGATEARLKSVPVGSRVELQGVCSVRADENGTPGGFSVVTRTPDDVTVLDRPPLWLRPEVLWVLAALAFTAAVALCWVGSLRRTVRRQTAAIRREVEQKLALEEQLRSSQKLEAIGRLAGGIAHDFNNLLTVIRGRAELLLSLPGTDPQRQRSLQAIHSSAQRATRLTQQLLAYSRRQMLQPRRLNLADVVHGISEMLRTLVGEQISLDICIDPHLDIHADQGQIEQVIMNLAANARDAMPGGGTLTLTATPWHLTHAEAMSIDQLVPGNYVLFTVADTGSGMTEEVRKHLFEPFFTTKERSKGTGLGLASVHGIIHQSGGAVRVQSQEGRGTIVEVFLPPAEAVPQEQPSAAEPAEAHAAATLVG